MYIKQNKIKNNDKLLENQKNNMSDGWNGFSEWSVCIGALSYFIILSKWFYTFTNNVRVNK